MSMKKEVILWLRDIRGFFEGITRRQYRNFKIAYLCIWMVFFVVVFAVIFK